MFSITLVYNRVSSSSTYTIQPTIIANEVQWVISSLTQTEITFQARFREAGIFGAEKRVLAYIDSLNKGEMYNHL